MGRPFLVSSMEGLYNQPDFEVIRGEEVAVMRAHENKKHRIMNRAWRLFLMRGFSATSMRSIAEAAGVSLGLVTYHFTNKDNLALMLLERVIDGFKEALDRCIDIKEEPALYLASLVRINYKVMSRPEFNTFYIDAMKNDLYFKTISERRTQPDLGLRSLIAINEKYALGHSLEYLELFGNYLCVSMERTLVLYPDTPKAIGSIPDLVFKTYMRHIHPAFDDLEAYCQKSDEIVRRILSDRPELATVRDLFDEAAH